MQPEPHEAGLPGLPGLRRLAGSSRWRGLYTWLLVSCTGSKVAYWCIFNAVLILCGFSNHAPTSALARL